MKHIPTQEELYWKAHRNIASGNIHFLEMIKHPTNPLTKRDLKALISKNPSTWKKFAGFLKTNYMVA